MLARRLAAVTALLTLVLIVAGGLVTNTDSGLACPDWPMCFGSPFPKMVGGVLVEHTHRLIASSVGFLTVALVLALFWEAGHRGLGALLAFVFAPMVLGGAFIAAAGVSRTGAMPVLPAAVCIAGFAGCFAVLARASGPARLSVLALVLVMAQGLLGGLTVVYRLPPTILVLHLATSMLYLSVLVALAFRLRQAPCGSVAPEGEHGLLRLTAVAVYAQIVLGATVRHTGSGLVCGVDVPLCRGAIWPTHVHASLHLHMAHRAFALLVAGLVVASALRVLRTSRDEVSRRLALAAPLLVLAQIALGVLTIVTFKEIASVTGHLLVGALLLVTYVSLLARARLAPAVARFEPHPVPSAAGVSGARG